MRILAQVQTITSGGSKLGARLQSEHGAGHVHCRSHERL